MSCLAPLPGPSATLADVSARGWQWAGARAERKGLKNAEPADVANAIVGLINKPKTT
jgi:hypothetical protein